MYVSCIGSCRLNAIEKLGGNLWSDITLCHSTKDIIQLLKWVTNQIEILPEITRYCYLRGIWNQSPYYLRDEHIERFKQTDLFIIEICSYHSYVKNNVYYHTDILSDSKDPIIQNIPKAEKEGIIKITQDKHDLEKDILEILQIIGNKKIIIVSHVIHPENHKIPHRTQLIKDLKEICERLKILLLIPGNEIFANDPVSEIMTVNLNHYTQKGLSIVEDFFRNKLKTEVGWTSNN